MNTYNDTVIEGVLDYIRYILSRLSDKDLQKRVLKLVDYEIVDEGQVQLSDLMRKQDSLMYQLNLNIDCIEESGEVKKLMTTILVPRMVNNVFVIGGKARIAINLMVNDGEVRRYPDNIVIHQNLKIRWKFPKGMKPIYEPEFFKVVTYDLDGNELEFEGYPENYEIYKGLLELDDRIVNKIKVKLGRSDIPNYLTYEIVGDLFKQDPDTRKDLVIDKRVSTIEGDFIRYLYNNNTIRKVLMGAYSFFKTGEIILTSLQSTINAYFRAAKSKCIEIPSEINPLIYDALKYKIVLPETTIYNTTFTDLIDPANTPENNNVNIINELNVCVNLSGSTIMYSCYDFKTHKKVQLPYIEYLTKKVLKCDYFNYDKMEVITSAKYEYKQFLKEFSVNNLNEVDIDLIEPSPDEKLSYTTRRIPLINMSDSVRVAMGCSMLKQAIQTDGCEPRLVSSGNDDYDYQTAHSIVRYTGLGDGIVTAITDKYIDIEDQKSGLVVKVEIPEPVSGLHGNLMTNDATVKVGEKVIPNQVIISPTTMKNGSYDLGVNAKTVYMSYLGYTYEDGVVISESYAKKCTQYRSIEVVCSIRSRDEVAWIVPIGREVHSLDTLVHNMAPPRASSDVGSVLSAGRGSTIMKAIECSTQDASVLTPNNIDLGYVTDVKIIRNPKHNLTEVTADTFDKFTSENEVSSDYNDIPDKYKNIKVSDYCEFKDSDSAIIKISIVSVNPMIIGDKSSNSWGGKGEISLVLPDELMPRLDLDGHGNGPAFDIIMNPAAVVARKNPSQLYECLLTKIINAIQKRSIELIDAGDTDGFKSFIDQYYPDGRFDKVKDLNEAVHNIFNFKMKVGSFSKIDYNTILEWMNQLNIKEDDYIYCPDVVIYQSPYTPNTRYNKGTAACSPEYAKTHNIKGKLYELGFVERPVITGMSYMYKLHHSGMDNGKVTSELPRGKNPIMGRGYQRAEGQKIGEMELWGLKSYGVEKFVTENNPDITRDENIFLSELMLTGLVVTDQLGLPFGLPHRKSVAQLRKEFKNK